jgi:hypothetical protein
MKGEKMAIKRVRGELGVVIQKVAVPKGTKGVVIQNPPSSPGAVIQNPPVLPKQPNSTNTDKKS